MRFIVCLLLFLFALGTAYAEDDADTLTVEGAHYRLDGIDAPELDQPCFLRPDSSWTRPSVQVGHSAKKRQRP